MMHALRSVTPFALAFLGAHVFVAVTPRVFPFAFLLGVSAAVLGSSRRDGPTLPTIVRSALLAAGTFGYALFLGGRVLPWIAVIVTAMLLTAGWVVPAPWRERIVLAQVLAASLAVGITSAAMQFFFPTVGVWAAILSVVAFLLLLDTILPEEARSSPWDSRTLVLALILTEASIVLRALPMHWLIGGITLTLAVAMMLDHARLPRAVFASLTVALLLFGTR